MSGELMLGGAVVGFTNFSGSLDNTSLAVSVVNHYLGDRSLGVGRVVITTDQAWFDKNTVNDTRGFGAYTSEHIPGQMTIWLGDTSDPAGILHELGHTFIPDDFAKVEPHSPAFYIALERMTENYNNYTLTGFHGLNYERLSTTPNGFFAKGGSEFENAVAVHGLTENQIKEIAGFRFGHANPYGALVIENLRDHLERLGFNDAALSLSKQYEDVFGSPLPVTKCFPAHTQIQTSPTTSTAISDLRVGDIVMAFDPRADYGRGALVPKRVTRLYRNTTTEWLRLRWFDGTAREVITTPGHHFLDELGGFPTTPEMTRTGSATVVLGSGAVVEVRAERTRFWADVAPRVGRGMGRGRLAWIWGGGCDGARAEGAAQGC